MPRVADYTVIADSWTQGGEIEFNIPENFEPDNRCVHTFVLSADGLEDVQVTISLNGNQVFHWDFNDDHPPPQMFQEVIQTEIVRAGKNVFGFDFHTGPTALKVSDVVLWWQANV